MSHQVSPLLSLSDDEWESLCDRCGLCCLVKLEDEDTGEVAYTNVACEFLDTESCQCTVYPERLERKAGCVRLSQDDLSALEWLPNSCAYVQYHATGETVASIKPIDIKGLVVSEQWVPEDELPDHIVATQWIKDKL